MPTDLPARLRAFLVDYKTWFDDGSAGYDQLIGLTGALVADLSTGDLAAALQGPETAALEGVRAAYEKAKDHWSAQCFCFTSAPESMRRQAHDVARQGFDEIAKILAPVAIPIIKAEYAECERAAKAAPSPAPHGCEDDDYAWAHERVMGMREIAVRNASVYGPKLLRGYGYPDETFMWAQDARALSILLGRLPTPPPAPDRPEER